MGRMKLFATIAGILCGIYTIGQDLQAAIVDDLVFAYDMEAISGNTISDISGNGNDGTMASGLTTGVTDPLAFSTQHLRTPGAGSTASVDTGVLVSTPQPAFSFSIFIHDRGNAQARVRMLTSHTGSGGLSNSVLFDTDNAGGGQKELRLFAEGGLYKSVTLLPPSSNSWQHFGVVYDAGTVTFYFNGVQHGTQGAIPATQITAQPHAWTLMNYPGDPSSDYIPNADYDDAALWYRALSAQEMQAVYSQGVASLIPEPGSLALLAIGAMAMCVRGRTRTNK